jgi:hypothetical protein
MILNYFYLIGWYLNKFSIKLPTNSVNIDHINKIKFYYSVFAAASIAYIGLIGGGSDTFGTSYLALSEIFSGEASEYSSQINDRLELYLNKEITIIKVKDLTEHPYLLYFDDITENSSDWRNSSVSQYYNKDKVFIDSSR